MKLNVAYDDGGAAETIGTLQGILRDFTPVWPTVDKIIVDMEKEQFRSDGAYGGERWEPLNPSYAAAKRRLYGADDGILRASGRLYGSLTDVNDADHLFDYGPNFGEFGTRVPYAAYHQRGNKNLLRRVVVPKIPREIGAAIVDAFSAYIFKRLRQLTRRR